MRKIFYITFILILTSCGSKKHYVITNFTGEYIPVTAAKTPDTRLEAFVDQYKVQLDKEMDQTIGVSSKYMVTGAPESLLTNLTTDIMLKVDKQYTDNYPIDISFMNVHGIRSPIAEGNVTVGDIFGAFPFDNTLTMLRIKGEYLNDIFAAIAKSEMVGVSGNIRINVKDKTVISSSINGKPIDNNRLYTIITLDYLADGNDTMDAFKKAEYTKNTGITLRDYMLDYVQELTKQNKELNSELDGRISIIK